jgi:predicted ATP-grasp superfamily ATP-dependent carboligase
VLAAAESVRRLGGQPVLQQVITGSLVAYCVFRDSEGRRITHSQQVATATFPPGAGVSTRAETEDIDAALASAAEKILDDLGAWGVAEIQFIRDAEGRSHLIDLNPRFYGSIALAIAAGADLPALVARDAIGEHLSPTPVRTRVRYQWLEGDLRRAGIQRCGGRARDLAATFAYARGAVHSIWSRKDPAPAIWFTRELGKRALRKASPWT